MLYPNLVVHKFSNWSDIEMNPTTTTFHLIEDKHILITNIKFSIKLKQELCLQKIHERCSSLINNHCRILGSKLVIRIPNQSKRIIIFPKKRGSPFQHINFTGINKFSEVESALNHTAFYLNCKVTDLLDLTIDNIWAKSDCLVENMKTQNVASLNLRSLLSVLKQTLEGEDVDLRFRPESFSAVVFRGFDATTLIYSTGSVVIVGARYYSCLEKIIEILSRISICQVSNFVLTQ